MRAKTMLRSSPGVDPTSALLPVLTIRESSGRLVRGPPAVFPILIEAACLQPITQATFPRPGPSVMLQTPRLWLLLYFFISS